MTSTFQADSVSLVSRQTLLCANEASWKALDSPFLLGPLDQGVVLFIPIPVAFIYQQPSPTPDPELIPVERLHRALERLLDYYPHLTGRLQIDPSDGSPYITHLGTGAELVVARCSERLDAFSSSSSTSHVWIQNLPAQGNALFPPLDVSMETVSRGPIFTVQHTRFACGSVALGVRILHKVCDADGFFQVVLDLAELYRDELISTGTSSLAHPPHIHSYMSELKNGRNMTPEERKATLEYHPELFHIEQPSESVDPVAEAEAALAAPAPPSPPLVGRFMRFSARELSALKAHATDPSGGSWVSTFDALSAHLYRHVYRARVKLRAGTDGQRWGELSPPDFLSPVNIRSRLGLPQKYFPNALICTYTSLPHDVLVEGPLWKVAQALHEMTRTAATTVREEMDKTVRWIAAQPDKERIGTGFRYGNGALMVSQWNKFDLYESAMFGVRPVLVAQPFTAISLVDGLGYIYPAVEEVEVEGAGVEVSLVLSEPVWNVLERDVEFRRFRDA